MKLEYIFLAVFLLRTGIALRLYPYVLDPRDNPDYERYAVSHPSLDVFGTVPQFATLRYVHLSTSEYINLIDQYCLNPNTTLGHVIWPGNGMMLFGENIYEFIDYVARKGLYITSIHGFPPTNAGYRPPKEVLLYLEGKLGSRWLGISNGEQDGHYLGAFAPEEIPLNSNRQEHYINFRNYFRRLEDILGPRMTTLLSQTFPHYQLKAGLYTIAGAETSQSGPNSQVRYSFIRGAGKQYGVIWFGNVSVFNRFGQKSYVNKTLPGHPSIKSATRNYTCSKKENGIDSSQGPQCGTSLNLMKRLMYSHMMYKSGYVSFEGGWFLNSSHLSPVGLIQHNAFLWSREFDTFGVHITTIGLYLDFYSGWTAPRQNHYYYRVWYSIPYAPGDYLVDEILRMVYLSYQDSSYFHDETGESSATPYGDTLDVILSDAPTWVLHQYDTIIVASNITGGLEVKTNLQNYIESGGHLVITAGNVAKLSGRSLYVSTQLNCKTVEAGSKVTLYNGKTLFERYNMSVCDLQYPTTATILAMLDDQTPLAVKVDTDGGGSIVVFATLFAISSSMVAHPKNIIDTSFPSSYPFLDHAKLIMDEVLTNSSLFTSIANLTLVPSYIGKDQFYVLVSNPELRQQPLKLLSPQGVITHLKEIALDQSEKGAVGYLPDGFQGTDLGKSTNTTIAGVDTRLFEVTLSSHNIQFLPKVQPKPRPRGIALHLRHIDHSIRNEILCRPTFFQHYDSVVVDYSYLITKDDDFLSQESQWLQKQNVTVHVDASPSVDMFPDLRFTKDATDWYNGSITSMSHLLRKMSTLHSRNLIISFHPFPTGQAKNKSYDDFNKTFHYLTALGQRLGITLHLLDTNKNPKEIEGMNRWLLATNLSSMQLVLNLAKLVTYGQRPEYDELIQTRSSFLYINAPGWDEYGTHYSDNLPIHSVNSTARTQVEKMITHVCKLRVCPYQVMPNPNHIQKAGHTQLQINGDEPYPLVLDAVFPQYDDEFADVHIIEELLVK